MAAQLSALEARRIALAAQGFGRARDGQVGRSQVLRTVERLGVVQIDSVNILARTHYLPLFSRLGGYDRGLLEQVAWGPRRALFEYWGHEASLMPWAVQPLMRWRMEDAKTASASGRAWPPSCANTPT